jgi:hypothetical protein
VRQAQLQPIKPIEAHRPGMPLHFNLMLRSREQDAQEWRAPAERYSKFRCGPRSGSKPAAAPNLGISLSKLKAAAHQWMHPPWRAIRPERMALRER